MKAFIIIKSSYSGTSEYSYTAYIDENVAKAYCEDNKEEYTSYQYKQVDGEVIPNNRIIYNNRVYEISNLDYKQYLINRIKTKLTKEEIQVLGI